MVRASKGSTVKMTRHHYKKTGRVGRHDIGEYTVGGTTYRVLYCFSPNSLNGVSLNRRDYETAIEDYDIVAVLCVAPKANLRKAVSLDTLNTRILPNAYHDEGNDGEYAVIRKTDLVGESWNDSDDSVL
jgi:hypothetical protein